MLTRKLLNKGSIKNRDVKKIIVSKNVDRIALKKDLVEFENPTIMAKNGIVLGVMDTGLINHQFFLKRAFKKHSNIENFGKLRKYLADKKANFYKKLFILIISSVALRSIVNYRIIMTNIPLASTIIAPAGTGKTAGVVLPTILMCDNDSIVVNDPKGEIYDLTKEKRSKLGHIVYFKWDEPNCPFKWNPVELVFNIVDGVKTLKPTYEIATIIGNMANTLISSDSKGPFWNNSAKNISVNIAQYLIYLQWEEADKPITLAYIKIFYESLGTAQTESELEEQERLKKKPNVDVAKELRIFKHSKCCNFLFRKKSKRRS